jgi:hypothetical protein
MLTCTPNDTPITSPNKQQPSAEKLNVVKARRRLFIREQKIRKVLLPYTKRLQFSPDSSLLPEVGSPRHQETKRLEWSGDESSPIKIVNKTIDLDASTELSMSLLSPTTEATPAPVDALPTEVWDIINSRDSKTAWHVVVNTTYTVTPSDNVL